VHHNFSSLLLTLPSPSPFLLMCGRFSNAQPVYQYTASVEEQLRRRRRNQNNNDDNHEAYSQPTKTIPTNSSSSSGSTECDNSLPLHTAVSEEDYYPTHNVSPTSRVPVLRLETPVPLPLSGQREKKAEEEENNNSKNGNENGLLIECMRWGLLPAHTTAIPRGPDVLRTINARDDSVLSFQSMWTPLLQKGKRCVVFCQGFFEWQKKGDGTKIAHFVGMLDNGTARTDVNGKQKALMPMAGLYERCIIDEQEIYSFTIITTESNKQLNFLVSCLILVSSRTKQAISRDT
jgi:putative SOS response-associated peptidase YedK